ncbi:MAG: hypothetical protein IH588_01250 [Anaerolineales bacterium]|nr:hypothetical protein [Anaerolineales bacterium]
MLYPVIDEFSRMDGFALAVSFRYMFLANDLSCFFELHLPQVAEKNTRWSMDASGDGLL